MSRATRRSAPRSSCSGALGGQPPELLAASDATGPATPTASRAAGRYSSAQSVALKATEGTIHFTIDGSDPTTASPKYSSAIPVTASQTIKASAVGAFGYTIAVPAPAPPAPVRVTVPKLKRDALTMTRRMSIRSARRIGINAQRGVYTIEIHVGQDAANLGTKLVRRVRLL